MTPKDFALEKIAPYFINPTTCGYDKIEGDMECTYETIDGKMCIAGTDMLPNIRKKYKKLGGSILDIIETEKGQGNVFLKKSANILTDEQWDDLQCIHDYLAESDFNNFKVSITDLNLFTLEELEQKTGKKL